MLLLASVLLALATGGILLVFDFDLNETAVYETRFLFLPAYVLVALLVAPGAALLASALTRVARAAERAAWAAALFASCAWLALRVPEHDRHEDQVARDYGLALLAEAQGPSVIVTFGDNATQALAYLQVVEGARPDVAVVSFRLLEHDWYREVLGAEARGLVLPAGALDVAGIARANPARALYHSDPRHRRVEGFDQVPCGLLTRLVPSGREAPPPPIRAPHAFGSRYSPRDMRERSVLASLPHAYARVAEWYLEREDPARAIAALEQGLRVPVPEPPFAEFQEQRAGLYRQLAQLYALEGRRDEARTMRQAAAELLPRGPAAER